MPLKIAMNVHKGKQQIERRIKDAFCRTWRYVRDELERGIFLGRMNSELKIPFRDRKTKQSEEKILPLDIKHFSSSDI